SLTLSIVESPPEDSRSSAHLENITFGHARQHLPRLPDGIVGKPGTEVAARATSPPECSHCAGRAGGAPGIAVMATECRRRLWRGRWLTASPCRISAEWRWICPQALSVLQIR
ncbi:hypothetical protein PMAYCL1PPCAC_10174, partial [Pristionchus mayeri]